MTYRAFRDYREFEEKGDIPDAYGLCGQVIYRIPGMPETDFFFIEPERLCQDCSNPVITMRDKNSGKAMRVWHDETCPSSAPKEARLKNRALDRHS